MRRYSVRFDSIIIVRQITFLREIRPVQRVRQHGKSIYQSEKRHVQIEVDGGCQIGNEGAGEVNLPRRVGVLRMIHLGPIGRGRLVRDGGVEVLTGERERVVRGGRALHSLFRRREMISMGDNSARLLLIRHNKTDTDFDMAIEILRISNTCLMQQSRDILHHHPSLKQLFLLLTNPIQHLPSASPFSSEYTLVTSSAAFLHISFSLEFLSG